VAGLDCFGLARVVAVWDWAIFVSPFPKTFASVFRYRFVLVRYVFSIQSLHSHISNSALLHSLFVWHFYTIFAAVFRYDYWAFWVGSFVFPHLVLLSPV